MKKETMKTTMKNNLFHLIMIWSLLVGMAGLLPGGSVYRVRSELVQVCGVTLEPFPVDVDAQFEVRLTTVPPAEAYVEEAEFGLADLDAPDYLAEGIVDLGAYAVEHLALELDPFPRKPGVVFEAPEQAPEPSPFSVLANLKSKSGE